MFSNDELEKLKNKLFMLEMADRWESEDYRIANELRNEIKKLEGKIANE